MFKIKVKYGVDVEPLSGDSPFTIGALRRNENLKDVLGFGDNVNFLINGVTQPDDALVPNDATVVVETAANTKALALAA